VASIFGIVSLIFWSVTIIVNVTYAVRPFDDDDSRVGTMLPVPTTGDGALIEPRGCNRWQLVANPTASKTAEISEKRWRGLPRKRGWKRRGARRKPDPAGLIKPL